MKLTDAEIAIIRYGLSLALDSSDKNFNRSLAVYYKIVDFDNSSGKTVELTSI